MTHHNIYFKNSNKMAEIPDRSIDLIVTSLPYPMIEMWDEMFFALNPKIKHNFDRGNYFDAFALMHEELNRTWTECERVLKSGGIACINIGDAVRTLDDDFQLWSNHTMVNKFFIETLKLKPLPIILWRKSTNKPNKFMGSGMLPPSAYVTLEHEYILIFRKGGKRNFPDNKTRYESAYFWEERNNWFSDVWLDVIGTKQRLNGISESLRERSAAFPLEIACRLINMYSVYEDTVLDPFLGAGTTTVAAAILMRNSKGYEIQKEFGGVLESHARLLPALSREYNTGRLNRHINFLENWKNIPKHKNENYAFGVVTSQEKNIKFYDVTKAEFSKNGEIKVTYKEHARERAARRKS